MPRTRKTALKSVESYTHEDQRRVNNPPIGLVSSATDTTSGRMEYQHDPHIDPNLSWAGKAEGMSFEVPNVSLHVHERIDPQRIIKNFLKTDAAPKQPSLFDLEENELPFNKAIEFYSHEQDWSNRLIAGDSLLVMNSLLQKEGLGGKMQMVYIDPPYGIRYNSNFQPFINKRDVQDGKDDDLTSEPEMLRAFRDTWELEVHSYLTYLRDRLFLARELLADSGSIYVQISDENLHHVREILDEVFGGRNFCGLITFTKASAQSSTLLSSASDYLLWYARDKEHVKYHPLFQGKAIGEAGATNYTNVEAPSGEIRSLTAEEKNSPSLIPTGWKVFSADNLMGTRPPNPTDLGGYEYKGKIYNADRKKCWKTDKEGLDNLAKVGRLVVSGNGLYYKRYFDDFPYFPLTTSWTDTASSFMASKIYVVQTNIKVIQRCLLMTTDPGDLVLDITCGSGTTAFVAEQWGRRWITCDTSRIAISLAKQRLMTAKFDYYQLAHLTEGISSGLQYKKVPHIMLGSLANNDY